MPIVNIIDRRKHAYRFLKINAIIEAACHDNSCDDSDQVMDYSGPGYDERKHWSLEEAVQWANSFEAPITLYLYDENDGIFPVTRTKHFIIRWWFNQGW